MRRVLPALFLPVIATAVAAPTLAAAGSSTITGKHVAVTSSLSKGTSGSTGTSTLAKPAGRRWN